MNMKKRIVVGLIFILMVGIFIYTKQKNIFAQTTASISLSFNPTTVSVGSTAMMAVSVNSGGNQVVAVDTVLNYDTNRFNVSAINPNTSASFNLKTYLPLNTAQTAFDWTKAVNTTVTPATIDFGATAYNLSAGTTAPPATGSFSLGSVVFSVKPARRDATAQVTVRYTSGTTTDSNIVRNSTFVDILGAVGNASLKVMADPICRAAISLTDQVPGTNDLLYVVAKPWGSACAGCLEDLNNDGVIGSSDLLYVTAYWGQTCTVPANTP